MPKTLLYRWLIVVTLHLPALVWANPCSTQFSLAAPIVSREGGEDGIGGTGFSPITPQIPAEYLARRTEPDGIGGTGIVGTITGFGSICVNGQEIHYDHQTPTFENGMPSSANRLALGQTVVVRSTPVTDGFIAQQIHVLYEVQGPISAIDDVNHQLTVLGQRIAVAEQDFSQFHVGELVVISGQRDEQGAIQASRISIRPRLQEFAIIGSAHRINAHQLRIGSQLIQIDDTPNNAQQGGDMLVRGTMQNGVFNAQSITANPRATFLGNDMERSNTPSLPRANRAATDNSASGNPSSLLDNKNNNDRGPLDLRKVNDPVANNTPATFSVMEIKQTQDSPARNNLISTLPDLSIARQINSVREAVSARPDIRSSIDLTTPRVQPNRPDFRPIDLPKPRR